MVNKVYFIKPESLEPFLETTIVVTLFIILRKILLNKDINSFWENKILQMIPKLYSVTMFSSCELIMQKIKSLFK